MSINTCECLSTFPITTVNYLESLVYDNKFEVSGELNLVKSHDTIFNKYNKRCNCIKKIFYNVYNITTSNVSDGNSDNAKMVESRFNFHVHPESAYKMFNCELGWPSKDDYITFLQTFLKYDTAFHCVISVEGIYVISVNANMVSTIYGLKDGDSRDLFDKNVDKYINIDKTGYTSSKGYEMNGINIVDGHTYELAINNFEFPDTDDVLSELRNQKLFKLCFLSWNDLKNPDLDIGFCVTFPKVNNTCEI